MILTDRNFNTFEVAVRSKILYYNTYSDFFGHDAYGVSLFTYCAICWNRLEFLGTNNISLAQA